MVMTIQMSVLSSPINRTYQNTRQGLGLQIFSNNNGHVRPDRKTGARAEALRPASAPVRRYCVRRGAYGCSPSLS